MQVMPNFMLHTDTGFSSSIFHLQDCVLRSEKITSSSPADFKSSNICSLSGGFGLSGNLTVFTMFMIFKR